MAKRRKKTKISGVRRTRSKMSGIGNINFANILAIGGGAIIGSMVNKYVPTTLDQKLVSGGKIALGLGITQFVKNPIGAGIGAGMIALGFAEISKQLAPKLFSGFGEDNETVSISLEGLGDDVLSGQFDDGVLSGDDISVVNGDDLSVVNGDDDDNDLMFS